MLAGSPVSESLAVDVRGAEALRAKAHSGDPEALRAAAKQFEAMFLQIVLKTMRQTKFSTEDDPFANSNSLKLYQDLLDQQWTQRMSSGRGLGFADAMYAALSRNASMPVDDTSSHKLGDPTVSYPDSAASAATAVSTTAPAVTPNSVPGNPKQAFIDALLPQAEKAAQTLGVPASFIVAQAALETGWGRKPLLSEDGSDSYNLFGIKAGAGWQGDVVEQVTTEYQYGVAVKQTERFRAYGSYEEALTDYAALLKRRYPLAVGAGDSAETFTAGLVAGGYATDPAYDQKLQRIIAQLG